MKNIYSFNFRLSFVLFLLLNSTFLFSQTPQWQWVRGGGSDLNCNSTGNIESCKWLGTDANGNIYGMSALGSGTSQIGTSSMNGYGYDDFAVFSYKCDGTFRWVRYFGSGGNDLSGGLAVDNSGNVFVSGEVGVTQYSDAHFGDSIIPATTTMDKGNFIAKLDSNGNIVWLNLPGPIFQNAGVYFLQMGTDNFGNICELAWFLDPTNWNGFSIPAKGYYVLKFGKNNGNLLNVTKLDFNSTDNFGCDLLDFKIDNNNNYYLNNVFTDTVYIGGIMFLPGSSSLPDKYFIAKFDSNGNNLWKDVFGGAYLTPDYVGMRNGLLCYDNNIYLTGFCNNGSVFYGDTIYSTISNQYPKISIIAKISGNDGSVLHINHISSDKSCDFKKLAIDKKNNCIIGSVVAGSKVILNNDDTIKPFSTTFGALNFFILSIDTSLSYFNWGIGTKLNSSSNDIIQSLFLDNKNNIFVGGMYTDSLYDSYGNGIHSNGGASDFFVAKVSVSNDCNCTTAIPNTQVVSLLNNTLTVKGNATGTLDSLYWFWGDGTSTKYITQNTNVSHTYQSAGSYTVCLRTYNYCGTQDSCTHVTMVGINETELKEIKTYPNPVNKDLIIENPYYKPLYVNLYNSMGLLIFQKQYENQAITIDMSKYVAGVYFVEIQTKDGIRTVRKVVIE
ncbi:MAG: T9SS type A sorting domain-containing protein [Bacteroidota bacterium]